MKKNIIKKIFIKISKILGYEIIDQNEFYSPTLEKSVDENLSNLNKSIVLPLGEVKLTRKINSILILFRTNTNVEIWDQNKKRIFEFPKIEYVLRSLNSLIKSINYLKKKKIINHKNDVHKELIKKQSTDETFANLSSLLKCFEIGKNEGKDLVFFVEDDYIHFETALEEMVSSYERVSSQINKELVVCPVDYPYLYMDNEKTNLLIGSKRHWRTNSKTLCTFLISHKFIERYWDNLYNNCLDRHNPFEKYLNKIYEKELCISPVKSLSIHMTNMNSSYGLSPFINYKSLWEENDYK